MHDLHILGDNIKFVRFFFTDVSGRLCDFSIPIEEFESAIINGKGFDGSSIHGMARIDESDLVAKPDLKTLRVFPWSYEAKSVDSTWKEAVVFADIFKPNGEHYEGDSRYILKKSLRELKEVGATNFFVGPEPEFFLFKANGKGEPIIENNKPVLVDSGGYFLGGLYGEIRKEVQLILKRMGIETEYDHHEVANSQHEVDLRYKDALEMADRIILFKYVVKRVARAYGLFASFMPKPVAEQNGNGMHVHQSLFSNGQNLFYDPNKEHNLSDLGLNYLSGLMKFVAESTLIFNPWVNSYKRLQPGYEAPCYITWALRNRSDLIRVPGYEDSEKAIRFELRSPDPSCNPYLAFALMLRAGIIGVKEKIGFIGPTTENVYKLSEEDRNAKKIKSLPSNLREAIDLAKESNLMRTTLGEHLFCKVIKSAEKHWQEYQNSPEDDKVNKITSYEIEKLLPVL